MAEFVDPDTGAPLTGDEYRDLYTFLPGESLSDPNAVQAFTSGRGSQALSQTGGGGSGSGSAHTYPGSLYPSLLLPGAMAETGRDPADYGALSMIDRDRASWEQALKDYTGQLEARYGLARGSLYDPSDLDGVIRNVSYARNAGHDPAEFLQNQYRIYDTRAASGGSREAGGYNTNWADDDPRRFSSETPPRTDPRYAAMGGVASNATGASGGGDARRGLVDAISPSGYPAGYVGGPMLDRTTSAGTTPIDLMATPGTSGTQPVPLDQIIAMIGQLTGSGDQRQAPPQALQGLMDELRRLGVLRGADYRQPDASLRPVPADITPPSWENLPPAPYGYVWVGGLMGQPTLIPRELEGKIRF